MAEFYDDMIRDILSRLPVKSILCCRSVCKHWCALIDTNDFIKQHLEHSIATKTNHTLVLHKHFSHSFYSVELDSLNAQPLGLALPVKPKHRVTKVIGSCNGLLCLSVYENPGGIIIIWNPATRKHIQLPLITKKNPFRKDGFFSLELINIIHGFGYDSVSDDYHVLKLVQFYEAEDRKSFKSEANVYSMRSNSWRKVQDFPNYLADVKQSKSVLACGALHWFVAMETESQFISESMVVSFGLVTEECRVVRQPSFTHSGDMNLFLSELGGCLSVLHNYLDIGVVRLWVMKDYGVTESWTQLLEIMINPFDYVTPLSYSKSGDEVLLLLDFLKLLWFNLDSEKRAVTCVGVRAPTQPFNAVVYLQSFVSLGEKAENDENQGGENEDAKEEVTILHRRMGLKHSYPLASNWCCKQVDWKAE